MIFDVIRVNDGFRRRMNARSPRVLERGHEC